MATRSDHDKLRLLPFKQYVGVNQHDPLRFYYWPLIGPIYRHRVELCLAECLGGDSVLEIGFGAGLSFLNLHAKYKMIYGLDLTASAKDIEASFRERQIETRLQNGTVLSMPYEDNSFDTVLLISILEHLKPDLQSRAFHEICRVLKPGGQVVYGVPVERPLMVTAFRLMGVNIREHHFSTEADVFRAASAHMMKINLVQMRSQLIPSLGPIYEVGHFQKKEMQ